MFTTTTYTTTTSATRTVRQRGNTVPAYFLGRPCASWTMALAPSTVDLARAA